MRSSAPACSSLAFASREARADLGGVGSLEKSLQRFVRDQQPQKNPQQPVERRRAEILRRLRPRSLRPRTRCAMPRISRQRARNCLESAARLRVQNSRRSLESAARPRVLRSCCCALLIDLGVDGFAESRRGDQPAQVESSRRRDQWDHRVRPRAQQRRRRRRPANTSMFHR